jgi:hypothetical protein
MAEYIHCPPSILRNWLDGTTVPTLENLLRTCRFLKCSNHEFGRFIWALTANIDAAKEAIARAGSRGVSLCQKKSEVRQALEKALLDPCRSVLRGCAKAGLQKTPKGFIKPTGPLPQDRCSISAVGSQSLVEEAWSGQDLRSRSNEGNPGTVPQIDEPLSVHQIAADLGYANDGYIRQKFPALCAAISKRVSQ